MNQRTQVTKKMKAALRNETGKTWSVTGGRGTAYCWLKVQAPKSRRIAHKQNPDWNGYDSIPTCITKTGKPPWIDYISDDPRDNRYMSNEDCAELGKVFGLLRPAHCQGHSINPESWDRYMEMVNA